MATEKRFTEDFNQSELTTEDMNRRKPLSSGGFKKMLQSLCP